MPTGTEAPESGPVSGPAYVTRPDQKQYLSDLVQQQEKYALLRYRVAVGMLFVAPALIALPPRKMDLYTFGLAAAWVYCLNDVTKTTKGKDLAHMVFGGGGKELEDIKAIGVKKGWKGEEVMKQYKEREEEGQGIGDIIKEAVWDVWQQRDKRNLTEEQRDEEDLPLKERFALEQERKARAKETEASVN